MIKNACGF